MSLNNFGGLSFRQGISNPSNNVVAAGSSGVGTILNEQSAASIINASSNNNSKQYYSHVQNQTQSMNAGSITGVIGLHDTSSASAA